MKEQDRVLALCIPTNFQSDFVDRINWSKVTEVYGKLASDPLGGGRSSVVLPDVSKKMAVQHIKKIRDKGVSFNYLLNTSCMDNLEFTSTGQRRIRKMLTWLRDIGVDRVTVTIPYLLEIVKDFMPELKISVSTMAGVDQAGRAKFWEHLGADRITLAVTDVNRDFAKLKAIRNATTLELQLIANLDCLRDCPFNRYHANLNSHASQSGHPSGGFVIDYCYISCSIIRLSQPARFFMAGWIRPEDQVYYAKVGVNSLKLVNRAMTTDHIVRVVEAYTAGRYDGNLLDLFSLPGTNLAFTRKDPFRLAKYLLKPMKYNVFRLWQSRNAFDWPTPYVDNAKLENFLDYFVSGKCRIEVCGTSCRYCHEIARRNYRFPEERRLEAVERLKRLKRSLVSGKMFTYL